MVQVSLVISHNLPNRKNTIMKISELAQLIYDDLQLGENEDFLYQVRTKTAEEFAALAQFGLGLSIRNRYSLWDEKKWDLKDAKGMSMHPDDVSNDVLIEVYHYARRMLEN